MPDAKYAAVAPGATGAGVHRTSRCHICVGARACSEPHIGAIVFLQDCRSQKAPPIRLGVPLTKLRKPILESLFNLGRPSNLSGERQFGLRMQIRPLSGAI